MNKLIFSSFLSFFLINQSYACEINTLGSLNLAISTTEAAVFSYGITSNREEIPFFNVKNCQLTASKNKYLMVAMGPEVVELSDKVRGTNFNRFYVDSKCRIQNNPLKVVSSNADQKKVFEKKWKFINECIEIHLTEAGSRPILFPLNQEGCKVKVLSPKHVSFNGGFCFFKPKADSNLRVDVKIAEACTKIDGYKDHDVNLQDINGDISFYTSNEYQGDLAGLDAIGTSALRISTNPDPAVIKPGDDFGLLRPLFPENYSIQDLHLGKIQFNIFADKYVEIIAPIITSNFCDEISVGGVKSSYCDYAYPVVAEYFLKNEKDETLLNWYDGGVAPAQWQGVINGDGYQVIKDVVPTEKNYRLEVYFSDPSFDFNFFKQRIRSKLNATRPVFPVLVKDGSLNETPENGSIDVQEIIPTINPIGNMDFIKGISHVREARKVFESFFSTSMFPPLYSQVCKGSKGNCQKFKKSFAKFTASFRLTSDYNISNLKIKRESTIFEPYEKDLASQPEYQCN